MLSQFSFSNYKSFKEEAFLDFIAESIREHEKSVIIDKADGEKFLPVIVIYGPNGGGKSTVLEALKYLRMIVLRPYIYHRRRIMKILTVWLHKVLQWNSEISVINLIRYVKRYRFVLT